MVAETAKATEVSLCETKSICRTECLLPCASRDRIYLMNGFQMRGIIRGFDNFVVFLESDGKQQMIYKHAISTIIPQRQVELHGTREERTDS